MYNMKKLILLLLISGGLSAQVVVPKSTTTFSNVNAVGSMTVGGNLRVTGSETITGQAKLSNTLNIIGNTTINSNQTNTLTTGNTGTVAVLSDAVFPLKFNGLAASPADGTTYYFGSCDFSWTAVQNTCRFYAPYNLILVGYHVNGYVTGTLASSETSSLSIMINGSGTQLSSTINFTATANSFTNVSQSTNITAGDLIESRLVTPNWVTNPTSVIFNVTFYFVRRQ